MLSYILNQTNIYDNNIGFTVAIIQFKPIQCIFNFIKTR